MRKKVLATAMAVMLCWGGALIGCSASSDSEGERGSATESRSSGISDDTEADGQTTAEAETLSSDQEAAQTKQVTFGDITISVPASYQELDSSELGVADDSMMYYVDAVTGDGVCLQKGALPEEVTGDSMIYSLRSALSNTLIAFGVAEEDAAPSGVSTDAGVFPIYQVDDFSSPDGYHYAFRSVGFDLSTYYIVYAWSSSDGQDHLSDIVDTVGYVKAPSFELTVCYLIDAFGEEDAKTLLKGILEDYSDEDLEALTFAGIINEDTGSALLTELSITILKERRGGDYEPAAQSSTQGSSQSSSSSASSSKSGSSTGSTSTSQRNALAQAKSYLDVMAFSHSGLVEQLEYEGYSNSDAKYAADNCGANWKEQAARKAQEYLDVMAFSRSKLIDQLEYEGFTHDQAVYGVDKVGL